MPLASWLFVRGTDSIWIERPHGYSLIVAGPGLVREDHDFMDEPAMQAYQISLAERLTENGWFLWGFDRERRTGQERRHIGRPGMDRRRRPIESH